MLHPSQAWPPAASCPSSEPGPVRTKREQPVPALPSRQDPPEVSRPPPNDPHLSHLLMSCRLINHPGLPESFLRIRWPKDWNFSFSISPFNEHSELISFRMDWLDLLVVQGTLKSSATPQFKSINSLALSLLHSPTLTSIHDHWKNHSLD